MESTLQRAEKYVALGTIVVDHPQAAVATIILGLEFLAHIGDVSQLSVDDEELALLDMQKLRFDLTGINEVVGIFADAEGHEARRA